VVCALGAKIVVVVVEVNRAGGPAEAGFVNSAKSVDAAIHAPSGRVVNSDDKFSGKIKIQKNCTVVIQIGEAASRRGRGIQPSFSLSFFARGLGREPERSQVHVTKQYDLQYDDLENRKTT
jgi:hypothetical protein